MENLKEKILSKLDEKFINHKGINKLAEILSKSLKEDYSEVLSSLKELEEEGDIFEFAKHKYASSKNLGLEKGKFSFKNEKFGFVLSSNGDIYISKRNALNAYDGDTVLVKILSFGTGGKKREGKIVRVIKRDSEGLVGTFMRVKNYGYVTLDNKALQVYIPSNFTLFARDDDKVVLDIIEYKAGMPVGKILEVIGNINESGNDIKWLLKSYKVKDKFPDEVLKLSMEMPQRVDIEKYKDRRDLRGELIFTIDGKDAKDLDDGVSLTKNEDGTFDLGVHIADVGEYVKFESPIDKEAFERGTSIYFLNQVIPMLPKTLSNGICSLNPQVDRLALSVIMRIDKNGEVLSSEIFESIIKSKFRLNYDEVLEVLEGKKETCDRLRDVKDTLILMEELSNILSTRRKTCGSLDFELPEGEVIVDDKGKPLRIEKRLATRSTKIIETFMVACNECVAKKFENLKIPFIYRVHAKPDSEKMHAFFKFIESLSIKAPEGEKDISPKDLQKILLEIKDKEYAGVVNMVMLRSLKKAEYMEKCLGHFGMALNYYCHFTSPIRRYPDLTIHRIIKEYLHGHNSFIKSQKMSKFVIDASKKSSAQEKQAEEVERAITDYKKVEYMSQFVGKTFEGVISGVNSRGFYVELFNTCEGMVSVSSLKDNFYNFDEEKLALVSKNDFYRLGERVEVRLIGAKLKERELDFEVVKKIKK